MEAELLLLLFASFLFIVAVAVAVAAVVRKQTQQLEQPPLLRRHPDFPPELLSDSQVKPLFADAVGAEDEERAREGRLTLGLRAQRRRRKRLRRRRKRRRRERTLRRFAPAELRARPYRQLLPRVRVPRVCVGRVEQQGVYREARKGKTGEETEKTEKRARTTTAAAEERKNEERRAGEGAARAERRGT